MTLEVNLSRVLEWSRRSHPPGSSGRPTAVSVPHHDARGPSL